MTMSNHAAATLAARRHILGVQRLWLVPAEASLSTIFRPQSVVFAGLCGPGPPERISASLTLIFRRGSG